MGELTVRRYISQDAYAISDMEKKYFSTPLPEDYIMSIPQKENTAFFTCLDGEGTLIGYAGMMWVLDEGSIISIAVDEKHRGKGAASMLMQALKDYCLELELSLLTLEVRSSNAPALGLYNSCGFVACGLMKNYYSRPKEDAVVMTCYF